MSENNMGIGAQEQTTRRKTKYYSEAMDKAHRKYMEKFARFELKLDKQLKADAIDQAKANGESTTQLIARAIRREIERCQQESKQDMGEG